MIITQEEIIKHATNYFMVMKTGGTADELASFFLNPCPRIYLADTGVSISMEELYEFHKQWKYERHEFSHFNIMLLNAEPARVRALGTVYWEAGSDDMVKPIKNVVGEDWTLEKTSNGDLKFVLYINTFHHLLPDSAPIPF
jgi:hypothetical protein